MRLPYSYRSKDSFTLVELLVVIGILAILTAAVVIVLNPAELLKQSRDSKRTTDLASLNNAIKLLLTQNPDVNLGSASTVYVSLADSSSTCGSYALPGLPSGWQYRCATSANYQKTDGSGWVPVSFSSGGTVASLPALPVDPQNAGIYYYSYIAGGSWEIAGMFESKKYFAKAQNDAGADPERLEVGSDLALWKNAYGLVGYWPFDEGNGTSAADASGNGNAGTLMNGPAWQAGSNCKVGGCLSLDGADDYVNAGNSNSLMPASLTVMGWMRLGAGENGNWMFINRAPGGTPGSYYIYADAPTIAEWSIFSNAGARRDVVGPISKNEWYHIAGTTDASSQVQKIYINGILQGQQVAVPLGSNTSTVLFGSYGGGGYYLNGTIDDIRVYNRVLSEAEVQAIYNATK
jgi:type II secretory pathway pseudopilin PulG